MSTFETLIARLVAGKVERAKVARLLGRRAPVCESLEGRRLLSAASTGPGGWGGPEWGGAGAGAPSALVHHFGPHAEGTHAHTPGARDFHGAPGTLPALPASASPQAQADAKTLQADMKAFQAEIPASVTASLKADEAVIHQALDTLAPTLHKGHHEGAPPASTPGTDPAAAMTAELQKAGVPAATIADLQANQATIKGLDPTLQARITADHAALAKDLGLPAHPGKPGAHSGGPGAFGPMMF